MDWNGSNRHFVSRPENSFGFLYNNYNYDNYPSDIEMKQQPMMIGQPQEGVISAAIMEKNNYAYQLERKKRLTSDQLDSLETSFQEEIKLDPDRKMKLAQELGLQPRQVAVWFQNRRARWKNKQLERSFDKLQQEFDVVSKEKQKLQEEVLALRKIVKEQATMKQPTTGYTREETVESTSANNNHPPPPRTAVVTNHDYVFNVNGCNSIMAPPPYWGVMPPPNY